MDAWDARAARKRQEAHLQNRETRTGQDDKAQVSCVRAPEALKP